MHPKFINICDRPLYLLLVSSFLLLIILSPNVSISENINGEGMSSWDINTSEKEACDNAELLAKNNVLAKLGLEKIKSNQIEACIDTGDSFNCEMYQNTFNTISGGYIKSFEILNKEKKFINNNKFCVVKIIADAFKFRGKHDPKFIINADIGYNRRFFEGGNIIINAELSEKAYVNVLGWYPDIDKENYIKLFPNQFENKNFLKGKFNIPSKGKHHKYKLNIQFPPKLKKNESQEFIIVLATKKKFAILNKIKISELLTRLDDEGKSHWYMQKIGYSILRKK